MARPHLPSLELVLEEARTERAAQLIHFEALDAKAGVLLGFAGALVALAPDRADLLIVIGRFMAVVSGMSALASFWPRDVSLTHLRSLRDKYLSSEAAFTRLNLVDATIAQTIQVSGVLKRKARLLKVAMSSLGLAVICVSAAVT